jgi:hypothetical protein
VCSGYERDRIFLNSDTTSGQQVVRYTGQRKTELPEVTLHHGLARSAFEKKSVGMFWESYLPFGEAFTARSMLYTAAPGTNSYYELYGKDEALRLSLLAVSLGAVGNVRHDNSLSEASMDMYGEALREMSAALQDPQRAHTDAVLAATHWLFAYEVRALLSSDVAFTDKFRCCLGPSSRTA